MSKTTFKTNPVPLETLLNQCGEGKIQLPDFQRSWVWAEDRILSLISSISSAFPIGALMTLETQKGNSIFAKRPIQGADKNATEAEPAELLLDGQQRMTSLYQACMRREVVETITPKNKIVKRWFYINIQKALESGADRGDAIFSVPEDRRSKTNFDKDILLDLSTPELEYEQLMFPLNRVLDWDQWQEEFGDYWIAHGEAPKRDVFKLFKNTVLTNFKDYQVPVICLDSETSHEAVCLVFEKVNTGGKALDAFELLTAMYAAQGHKLRDDWLGADGQPGMHGRLIDYGRSAGQRQGVLAKVASTDVLQAIALLHTKQVRLEKKAAGFRENELPAVRASRQSLLDLPLDAYLRYRDPIEAAFKKAAKFLREQMIYRVEDLPYQSQLVPLTAILTEIGDASEHAANRQKIARWFWCGIFGELYGSAIESRFAKDIMEVPEWLQGGPEPSTIRDGLFRPDRLHTMRTRLSAAYKGIHALLMREGAKDFRSGQRFDDTVFFDEAVDIHHIFPRSWCEQQKISSKDYDSIVNKTPLSYRTNRIIGGVAPSKYLGKLEAGKTGNNGQVIEPALDPEILDEYLESHLIPVAQLRSDDFKGFIQERRNALLAMISKATGHALNLLIDEPEEGEDLPESIARDTDTPIDLD